MKLHRFIGDFDLTQQIMLITDKSLLNQFKNVLKFQVGEKIILCDGKGVESTAFFKKLSNEIAMLQLSERKQSSTPKKKITLYCGMLKSHKFDMVVQKSVELGVTEIVPIISRRTIKQNLKTERLHRIIKESCEQSGRSLVPVLHGIIKLDETLRMSLDNDVNLFFDASGKRVYPPVKYQSIGLFIGPEGGWEKQEIEAARKQGCQIIGLGSNTLRAETAAIVATYIATGY